MISRHKKTEDEMESVEYREIQNLEKEKGRRRVRERIRRISGRRKDNRGHILCTNIHTPMETKRV